MLIKDLVAQFNVVARTEYNKAYKEYDPKFKQLMFEYNSGPVASVDFPFTEFLGTMEEFTGQRKHKTFPEGYKFTVTNREWDMAIDVRIRDLKRSAAANNLNGLDLYRRRIADIPRIAKDHPIELAFDMLEAGDANTYGTCFDAQNLFDTTHSYGPVAGTQSNIVTGAGVTAANIQADLIKVKARFASFYYNQGGTGNARKRKLNENMGRMLIVAPVELEGVLWDVQNKGVLATGETNTLKGTFDYTTKHFTDTNDWYAVLIDDSMFRPFLHQIEEAPVLDMPTPQDDSARESKIYTYGANGSYTVAYGAWWKAIQVTNT